MDLARSVKAKMPKPPRVEARWKKPDQHVYKINTDAIFREDTMQETTSILVCDHDGELIMVQALWYPHVASPWIWRLWQSKMLFSLLWIGVTIGLKLNQMLKW
jgi:hypothetical protein